MPQFFQQVGLLLWKNFTQRRRQMKRNFMEILWPCGIFIILVLVRQRKPAIFPNEKKPFHFLPRALPSAGLLPFMHSVFCNYRVNRSVDQIVDLPSYSNDLFFKLIEDATPFFTNKTEMNNLRSLLDSFGKINQDLTNVIQDLEILNVTRSSDEVKRILTDAGLDARSVENLVQNGFKIFDLLNLTNGNFNIRSLDINKIITSLNFTTNSFNPRPFNLTKYNPLWKDIIEKVYDASQYVSSVATNIGSLSSFQKIFDDVNRWIRLRNVTSSFSTDIIQLVCGTKAKIDRKHMTTMNYTDLKKTNSSRSGKKFPSKGGSGNEKCNSIYPGSRVDCGWGGISAIQCVKLGCCFDSSVKNAKFCFCPTYKSNGSSCCVKRRRLVERFSMGSGYTGQIADLITRLLEGNILYTPDNQKTRKIVQKMSSYLGTISSGFVNIERMQPLFRNLLNATNLLNNDQFKKVENLLQYLQDSPILSILKAEHPSYYEIVKNNLPKIQKYVSYYGKRFNSTDIKFIQEAIKFTIRFNDEVKSTMQCYNLSNFFSPIGTEEELVNNAISGKAGSFLSSIVFLNLHENQSWPKIIEYKLRYNPDYTPSTSKIAARYWRPGPGPRGSNSLWQYSYINYGFVFMQDLIERTLVEVIANKTVYSPGVYIQQFSYPCYIQDNFIATLGNFMPLFMTLAWVYTISMVIKSIVQEKELRLKEVMKVMGLSNAAHWTAWFLTSIITITISIICLLLLLQFGKILTHSDVSLVFVVLLSFGCASVSLAFLVSVFFSKANISAACGGIIYFFTHLPYPLTLWFEDSLTFSNKAGVSLFSTTAFGLAFKYISRWEEQGIGAQWSNLFDNPMEGDEFNLGWSIIFMLVDIWIYLTLTWYLEHVLPGQYGIPKPWYFPFTSSYWCGIEKKSKRVHVLNFERSGSMNLSQDRFEDELCQNFNFTRKFEKEPTDLPVGIHINNLVKIYKPGMKPAVDGLNLKMFEGQVTALLGHNGAGKSTTMSVLTGLFPPTYGTAIVYGEDVCENVQGVRESLGLCPQHNVLFDHLSVAEHMFFYASLKGLSGKVLTQEIEKFINEVGLSDKHNEMVCNLSGGMKRKLSVAMAFIGGSKTVILDEPTSGVDPASRRGIWDLILKSKQARTILLSTHYMDEADVLGDRISIISQGKLQCCGTPLFLKRHFGKGYKLAISLDATNNENIQTMDITKFIKSYIPSAELVETINEEARYVLPVTSASEFSRLFGALDEKMELFGFKGYGLSDTTLEEVFLKACDGDSAENYKDDDTVSLTGFVQSRRLVCEDGISMTSNDSQLNLINGLPDELLEFDDVTQPNVQRGARLYLKQLIGLTLKRFHHAKRSRKGYLSQIFLPAIFVIVAMFVSFIRPPRTGEPSLKLSPEMYNKPNYIVVEKKQTDQLSERMMEFYTNYYKSERNVCKSSFCSGNYTSKYRKCSCFSGQQICPKQSINPPTYRSTRNDIVVDASNYNFSEYVLRTENSLKQHRYGGASFGSTIFKLSDSLANPISPNSMSSGFGVSRYTKVWYSLKGYHALPTYINLMNNAILHANLDGKDNVSQYGIVAYNHPMDFNQEQIDDMAWRHAITDLFVAIFVILAMAFVPASFLVYLVKDRVSKSKHVQLVSGLHPMVYWIGNYLWDMINYCVPALCVVAIFLAFNQQAYVSAANFPTTFLLLILYGWSMTPLMYPFSFYFDVPSTAYIAMIAANIFVGIVGTIATFILEFFEKSDEELASINHILKKVFLIFPNYCLGRGLMDLAKNNLQANLYRRFGAGEKVLHPLEWNLCGQNVTAMVISGVAYFMVTLFCQYSVRIRTRKSKVKPGMVELEEDVANEKNRIQEEERNGRKFILKTNELTKTYDLSHLRSKKILAVDQINIGVQRGECFGLLGVNGAGKTSTFKMLTGDTSITSGDAFVKGISLHKNANMAHKYMGYCPQFDALDELLTGRELLMFYSQVRGISKSDGQRITNKVSSALGLTQYMDRVCGEYSGGNKRKLSTAISLLGSPPLILMDEPSTGMDPGARKFLWNVVSEQLHSGKSVVLTSHSMEECEALCTRLAIMVNGVFRCLGSPQHLRCKYGTGYTVILRSAPSKVDEVQSIISNTFKTASLKDRHLYMLEYHIPLQDLVLSEVFAKLEDLKSTNLIEDYSVTQTTLDQIFVEFARQQVEAVQITSTDPEDINTIQLENYANLTVNT